ncbi:MAG: NAD-dependent epimerase/dehydratase family protein [Candidatus Omnitrophica bacterium]|nr:NAD-dependent epimerase/dehydratase family protein [Candidatus Omnitrophota bacterium]
MTGGFGFLGAPLTSALLQQGHELRVLDDASRGSRQRLQEIPGRLEIVQGDVRDPAAVRKAVSGTDTVFHLAAVNGTRTFYEKPDLVLEVGVKGTMNVLEAAAGAGVKEFFFASSSEVYQTAHKVPTDETERLIVPDPFNPRYSYGGSKIIGELLTIHLGKKAFRRTLVFRPHNVYGPHMGWEHVIPQLIARILQMASSKGSKAEEIRLPIQGSGKETRAFIFIDDFTDGLLTLFDRGENMNIYHIGTMEEVSIGEIAYQIAACLGIKIRLVPGKEVPGGTLKRCPNTEKIKKLGFSPRIPLSEGLRRTVEWYAQQKWQEQNVSLAFS